ncbi:hypothetical protein SNEBB_003005 [Seison nebaliae]|nr:hypothetical protein SNEBB_003005 [Seison nebaliae]
MSRQLRRAQQLAGIENRLEDELEEAIKRQLNLKEERMKKKESEEESEEESEKFQNKFNFFNQSSSESSTCSTDEETQDFIKIEIEDDKPKKKNKKKKKMNKQLEKEKDDNMCEIVESEEIGECVMEENYYGIVKLFGIESNFLNWRSDLMKKFSLNLKNNSAIDGHVFSSSNRLNSEITNRLRQKRKKEKQIEEMMSKRRGGNIVSFNDEWPPYDKQSIQLLEDKEMNPFNWMKKRNVGSNYRELVKKNFHKKPNYYRFRYSKKLQMYQQQLFRQHHHLDGNTIQYFLMKTPYLPDALLIKASVNIQQQEEEFGSQRDISVIEKIIYAYQSAFPADFEWNKLGIDFIFDYNWRDNRRLFIGIFLLIWMVSNRGNQHVAFELGKVLFLLNPLQDPLAIFFFIDILALKSKKYDFFMKLIESENSYRQLYHLPNICYSYSFISYQLSKKEIKNNLKSSNQQQQQQQSLNNDNINDIINGGIEKSINISDMAIMESQEIMCYSFLLFPTVVEKLANDCQLSIGDRFMKECSMIIHSDIYQFIYELQRPIWKSECEKNESLFHKWINNNLLKCEELLLDEENLIGSKKFNRLSLKRIRERRNDLKSLYNSYPTNLTRLLKLMETVELVNLTTHIPPNRFTAHYDVLPPIGFEMEPFDVQLKQQLTEESMMNELMDIFEID